MVAPESFGTVPQWVTVRKCTWVLLIYLYLAMFQNNRLIKPTSPWYEKMGRWSRPVIFEILCGRGLWEGSGLGQRSLLPWLRESLYSNNSK